VGVCRHITILVMIGCLFAVPLYSDMEDARRDEAVLDFRLRSHEAELGPMQQLMARGVRVGLRIRRLILP